MSISAEKLVLKGMSLEEQLSFIENCIRKDIQKIAYIETKIAAERLIQLQNILEKYISDPLFDAQISERFNKVLTEFPELQAVWQAQHGGPVGVSALHHGTSSVALPLAQNQAVSGGLLSTGLEMFSSLPGRMGSMLKKLVETTAQCVFTSAAVYVAIRREVRKHHHEQMKQTTARRSEIFSFEDDMRKILLNIDSGDKIRLSVRRWTLQDLDRITRAFLEEYEQDVYKRKLNLDKGMIFFRVLLEFPGIRKVWSSQDLLRKVELFLYGNFFPLIPSLDLPSDIAQRNAIQKRFEHLHAIMDYIIRFWQIEYLPTEDEVTWHLFRPFNQMGTSKFRKAFASVKSDELNSLCTLISNYKKERDIDKHGDLNIHFLEALAIKFQTLTIENAGWEKYETDHIKTERIRFRNTLNRALHNYYRISAFEGIRLCLSNATRIYRITPFQGPRIIHHDIPCIELSFMSPRFPITSHLTDYHYDKLDKLRDKIVDAHFHCCFEEHEDGRRFLSMLREVLADNKNTIELLSLGITIAGFPLNTQEILSIVESLKTNDTLRQLSLSDMPIERKAIRALALLATLRCKPGSSPLKTRTSSISTLILSVLKA